MTPAEAAGIHLPFEDEWGDQIRWATIFAARERWPVNDDGSDLEFIANAYRAMRRSVSILCC